MKSTSFNVWIRYFVWNFKGTFWNSTQNILPILWKIWFLYNFEILRARNAPPGWRSDIISNTAPRDLWVDLSLFVLVFRPHGPYLLYRDRLLPAPVHRTQWLHQLHSVPPLSGSRRHSLRGPNSTYLASTDQLTTSYRCSGGWPAYFHNSSGRTHTLVLALAVKCIHSSSGVHWCTYSLEL